MLITFVRRLKRGLSYQVYASGLAIIIELSPTPEKLRDTYRSSPATFPRKEPTDTEKEIHTKELEKIKNKLDNVLFVSYSTNIFGIKLN